MVTTNNNVDDKLKTANDVSNVLNFFGGFRLFAVTTFCRLLIYQLQIFLALDREGIYNPPHIAR